MDFNDRFKYLGTFYSSGISHSKVKDWERCDNSKIPDCLELIYCISGKDEIRINGKKHLITPGTVRILPPSTQVKEDVWIRTLEHGEFVDVGFITKNPFVTETMLINAKNNRKIHDLFMQLSNLHKKNIEKSTEAYFFEGSSTLFILLYELQQVLDTKNSSSKKIDKILEPAIKHIYKHYCDKEFSLIELPQMCNIKKDRFYSMFRERYNTTPSAYVTNLRMQYAAKLLVEENLTISDVIKKTGYKTSAYFSRAFKKHFGITPSKYR